MSGSWPPETVRSLSEIRKGISYYRFYLLLAIVAGLVTIGAAAASGTTSVSGITVPPSNWGSGNNSSALNATSSLTSANLGIVALAGVAELVGFVFLLVSWITWRGGVRALVNATGGPYAGPAGAAAEEASTAYGRTVLTFIIGLVVAILLATLLVAAIIASVTSGCVAGAPTTCTAPTGDQFAQARATIIGVTVAIAIFGAILNVIAYHFATRSFEATLRPFGSAPAHARVVAARPWILLGAALAPIGLAALLAPALGLIGLVSPILVLYGFQEVVGGFDTWLESPPPAPTPAAPPPPEPPSALPGF